jgi:D-glycero-alpha-D-manno-heptose-7-phosphate kinase
MLLGTSPLRLSFAGGGTDLKEYYENFEGSVVSTAINHFTYVIVTPRQDNSIQIFSSDFQLHFKPKRYDELISEQGTELAVTVVKSLGFQDGINLMINSEVAPGSGLGASSSLAVNLVKTISTLTKEKMNNEEIAEMAYDIGRNKLNWFIGKQDEYISAFGGFNFIKFNKDKVTVNKISINRNSYLELEKNLLLFYIGKTRHSSNILQEQIKQITEKNQETLNSLHCVKDLSEKMYSSLSQSDITKFGELLNVGWESKKKFSKNVTNQYVDELYDLGINSGALGGKLTGAGGGGHLLFYCEPSKQEQLIQKMQSKGLKQVKIKFYESGCKVLDLYDFTNS